MMFSMHAERVDCSKKLASEAKSFQKLTRLVAVGISDDAAKKIVEGEIGSTLKRFCQLLGQAARCFQDENGEQFKKEFLGAAAIRSKIFALFWMTFL